MIARNMILASKFLASNSILPSSFTRSSSSWSGAVKGTLFGLFCSEKASPTMATPPPDTPSEQNSSSGASHSKPKFRATKEELKARLSPIQYQVTQLKSTERPGTGEYNRFNKKGSYHCVVCDEELFKSDTKFESGCGWPAFFDAADKNRLKFEKDYALLGSAGLLLAAEKADLIRTEVLCANCDAHLGHVFDDGPISKGGKRYCINSAALKFKPPNSDQEKTQSS